MTEKEYHGYKIEGVGKGKADYYVYTDLCKGCGLCIAKCPMNKAGKKCLDWSKEVGLYQTPAVAPDPEVCIACGACAANCPVSCISDKGSKYEIDPSMCISCGTCASVCPVDAPEEE